MKIGIVGLGVVGSAVKNGFEQLGHTVFSHDIKLDTKIEAVLNAEIVYLCVPTPPGADGKCDTSIIEEVVGELVERKFSGIIALKSTVAPGTTRRLQAKHDNQRICHVPEFLRERCAATDFMDNHDLCVIGTEADWIFERVKESHGHFPKQFVRLSPTEAELCKYFNNVYNAMLVTFANNFYELCQTQNADYSKIKSAMVQRDHIFNKYLDASEDMRGFGGMCLPKDTSAIAAMVKELGLPMGLFESIVEDNKKYKITVFEGMRK